VRAGGQLRALFPRGAGGVLIESQRDRSGGKRPAAAGWEQRLALLAVAFAHPFAHDSQSREPTPASIDIRSFAQRREHGAFQTLLDRHHERYRACIGWPSPRASGTSVRPHPRVLRQLVEVDRGVLVVIVVVECAPLEEVRDGDGDYVRDRVGRRGRGGASA
jgi:hypothetical protein